MLGGSPGPAIPALPPAMVPAGPAAAASPPATAPAAATKEPAEPAVAPGGNERPAVVASPQVTGLGGLAAPAGAGTSGSGALTGHEGCEAAEFAGTQQFDLSDDVSVVTASEALAAEARERLQFLCPEDQKMVCRRECQLASKREEAVLMQARRTIEAYAHALQVGRAVAEAEAGAEAGAPEAEAPSPHGGGLSPELIAEYEDRMRIVREIMAALADEPAVSLPALSPVELAKGFVFKAYAQTACVVNKMKDNAAELASAAQEEQAQAQGQAQGAAQGQQQQPLLEGGRALLGSLASRLRGRSSSGGSGSVGGGSWYHQDDAPRSGVAPFE